MEGFMTLHTINFAAMVRREGWSFMGCEENFITMKLIWHGYLILSLGIYVYETLTETGLGYCKQSLRAFGRSSSGLWIGQLTRVVQLATFWSLTKESAGSLC